MNLELGLVALRDGDRVNLVGGCDRASLGMHLEAVIELNLRLEAVME
jgi:hypothetical protein